ncbi:MAG: hypothetical protein V9F01_14025 [Chitinophagaceae bacterium]
MHQVTFGFTLTGALEDVQVFANGVPVQCFPTGSSKFSGGFLNARIADNSELVIHFHLTGSNGTAYSIEYQFLDNGTKEEDNNKPSPVTGRIRTNNEKAERIRFKA